MLQCSRCVDLKIDFPTRLPSLYPSQDMQEVQQNIGFSRNLITSTPAGGFKQRAKQTLSPFLESSVGDLVW